MRDLLLDLVAYDPSNRGIDRSRLEGGGLRITDAEEMLALVMPILKGISGLDHQTISRELAELFSYRLLFLLLPEKCLFGEQPSQDKPVIAQHLTTLGIEPTDEIVRALKFLVDNFRSKTGKHTSKTTVTDVYVRYPQQFRRLMELQKSRCAVCGAPLKYGLNMQLDHVLPWHLGDDPHDGSNWQFLCNICNRGKGMWPHYSLSPLTLCNWIKPGITHTLSEGVRYAALKRDGKCWRTGIRPTDAELTVTKWNASGCWVLDNVRTVCA